MPDSTDDVEVAASTPRSARTGILIGARALTGVIGIVIGVGVIAAATFLPLPTLGAGAPSTAVTPVPAAQQLVCPGSVMRLGDENGANATTTSAIGSPTTTREVSSGTLETRTLASTDAGGGSGAPILVTAEAAAATSLAGAQSQIVSTADYRGFAAAECARPSSDSWLVGGSTATGRTTLLTIANPGAALSTVTIEIFGEDGIIDAPGTNGIVVAPGSQRVLSLAGFAPSLESLSVHVTSRGGPVVANLQQSIVRGIDAGGVEIIGATTSPAETNVIPGVLIHDAAGVEASLGAEGYDDLGTVVRLLVPGTEAAEATIRVIPTAAGAEAASFDLSLPAGIVTDVPVDELPDGSYTVVVETSVPVAASVRASTISDGASDLAWFASADALTDSAFVVVATGPSATLQFGNPGDESATVLVGDVTVEVPARSSAALTVDDNSSYLVTGADGLFASVSYSAAGRLGSYLVGASATREPAVVVYP